MRAVLAGMTVQMALVAVTPFVVIDILLQPLVYGLIVGSQIDRPDVTLMVGIAFFGVWGAVITQGALAVVLERQWRTLEFAVASPTSSGLPLAGKVLAAALNGLLAIPGAWLLIALAWDVPTSVGIGQVAAAIAVGVGGFIGLGMLLVGFLARHRFFAGMLNGLYDVLAVLACLFVPAALLPGVLDSVSWLLGPRWAMEALRVSASGGGGWNELAIGAGASLCAIAVGVAYLMRYENALRRHPEALLL